MSQSLKESLSEAIAQVQEQYFEIENEDWVKIIGQSEMMEIHRILQEYGIGLDVFDARGSLPVKVYFQDGQLKSGDTTTDKLEGGQRFAQWEILRKFGKYFLNSKDYKSPVVIFAPSGMKELASQCVCFFHGSVPKVLDLEGVPTGMVCLVGEGYVCW